MGRSCPLVPKGKGVLPSREQKRNSLQGFLTMRYFYLLNQEGEFASTIYWPDFNTLEKQNSFIEV